MKKRNIYLDNASTTPLDPRVLHAMMPYLENRFGNPSNIYELGRDARWAVEEAKQKIARVLECKPNELVFTGGATEADNLAIAGVARANKDRGNKIIISSVEHKGILAVCDALEHEGFEVIKLPVDKTGTVSVGNLERALDDRTILVSITMADSETGTLQPVREIGRAIAEFRKRPWEQLRLPDAAGKVSRGTRKFSAENFLCPAPTAPPKFPRETFPVASLPYFHTDASQAAAYENLDVDKLGVDLMTLSAHKLGGPKGIGGLFIRSGITVLPLIFGGGQQGKLRSGTENVPGIIGFAEALTICEKKKKSEAVRLRKLRSALENGIAKTIPKVIVNGHPIKRLPNFLNVSILDIEGEALLLHLDNVGIMAGTGSACNSESLEPSYVLTAFNNPYEFVHGSIRFTLGSQTKQADISYVLKQLPEVVNKLRRISPLNLKLNQKEKISQPKAFIGGKMPHFIKKKHG